MKTAVFTVISNNYSAQARVLCHSLAKHQPEWDRFILVVDAPSSGKLIPPGLARCVDPEEIHLPLGPWFFVQYSVLEANCAVKPWMFLWLFEQGYEAVVYLDPDIQVFSPFVELKEGLREHDLILTPHLLEPYGDAEHPGEVQIGQSGIFNLGFAAFRDTPSARNALQWWREKLTHDCRVDVAAGIFVDQSWMNFAPAFFHAHLFREAGYNVAYWNLHERKLCPAPDDSGAWWVNGKPLRFFHFSGFDYDDPVGLSRYQRRYQSNNLPVGVEALLRGYTESLRQEGHEESRTIPYGLGKIEGLRLPDFLRQELVRTDYMEAAIRHGTPQKGWVEQIIEYLHRPDAQYPWLPALWARLYRERPDLQRVYPGCAYGLSIGAFAHWFETHGKREYGLDPVFPVKGWWTENPPKTTDIFGAFESLAERVLGRSSFWPKAFLEVLGMARRRAALGEQKQRLSPITIEEKPFINLYGFFQAASGVGESAWSMHRVLKKLGYPHRVLALRQSPPVSHPLDQAPFGLPSVRAHLDFIVMNMDGFDTFLPGHPEMSSHRKYRIQYSSWEQDVAPPGLAECALQTNEIWCPSQANAAVLRRGTDRLVRVAGLVVSAELHQPRPFPFPELRSGMSRYWLAMCDCQSYPERKGPDRALEAYLKAFPIPSPDMGLILKISHGHLRPEVMRALHQRSQDRPDVWIQDLVLSRSEIHGLLQHAFGLISLHRHEGFGLPIAEAIELGKQVVVTAYGGNMDFCTPENSWLVPYSLVPLEQDLPPYQKGHLWAEPEVSAAAELIRRASFAPLPVSELKNNFNQANFDNIRRHFLDVEKRLQRQDW